VGTSFCKVAHRVFSGGGDPAGPVGSPILLVAATTELLTTAESLLAVSRRDTGDATAKRRIFKIKATTTIVAAVLLFAVFISSTGLTTFLRFAYQDPRAREIIPD
jgi:hypothetical protein